MAKVILKFILGIFLGMFLSALIRIEEAPTVGKWVFCIVFSVGIVGGIKQYLAWMAGALNVSLKLGLITWLSFGTGIIGFFLLILVLAFILIFGWIYGWFLLIKELLAAL